MALQKALTASLAALALPSLAAAQTGTDGLYYSNTWAGPVQIANRALDGPGAPPTGFNVVEATLIMPHLAAPPNPRQPAASYSASYWIGLDGFVASTPGEPVSGLFQAGTIMSLDATSGAPTYTAFYEWIPLDPVLVPAETLALAQGDHLHVRLNTSTGGLFASATLTNVNTSQVFGMTMNAPVKYRGPTWPAPGKSAEWIVEAGTDLNGTRFVWPDFGRARFLGARACYNASAGGCVEAGTQGSTQIAAVLWNDTSMLYSRTDVEGAEVGITYVEEKYDPWGAPSPAQ